MEAAAAVTQKPDANTLAGERTDWALDRTYMAADRTLMAWVRTAFSMIGFGFTCTSFFSTSTTRNLKACHPSTARGIWVLRSSGWDSCLW